MPGGEVRGRRRTRALVWAILLALPLLAAVAIPWAFAGATIFDATPLRATLFGNDEVYYWHQTATYVAQGFEGGYYAFNELAAEAGWSHFDLHGPAHPVFYGTIGKAMGGWEFWTPMVINVALLELGILIFLLLVRPPLRTLWLFTALLISFAPIWIYLISGMQEALHLSAALVLGGLFAHMLGDRDKPRRWVRIAAALLLVVLSAFRPTWALLFVPLFMLWWKDGEPRSLNRSSLYALPIVAVMFLGYSYVGSEFPYGFVYEVSQESNPLLKLARLKANIIENWSMLLQPGINRAWVEWMQHLQLALVGIGIVLFVAHRSTSRDDRLAATTAGLILGLPAIVVVLLYGVGDWRDYRVMAPHLLLAVIVLLLSVRSQVSEKLVLGTVIIGVAFLPGVVLSYDNWNKGRFNPDMTSYNQFAFELRDSDVEHVEGADPWCNTLLWRSRINVMPNEIIMFPRGMGMSFVVRGKIDFAPKSGWYLSDQRPGKIIDDAPWMKKIKRTEFGWIYKNLGSGCWRPGRKNTPVALPAQEPVPEGVRGRKEWWKAD